MIQRKKYKKTNSRIVSTSGDHLIEELDGRITVYSSPEQSQ